MKRGRVRKYEQPENILNLRVESKWLVADCRYCSKVKIRSNSWHQHFHNGTERITELDNKKSNKTFLENLSTSLSEVILSEGLQIINTRYPLGMSEEQQLSLTSDILGNTLSLIMKFNSFEEDLDNGLDEYRQIAIPQLQQRQQEIQSQFAEIDNLQPVSWEEVIGLNHLKQMFQQLFIWPIQRPALFVGVRAPPKTVLLFGPPGNGKTMIGRALASESKANFFSITAGCLTSKWYGESENSIKKLFKTARKKQPSIIFIDQIDALLSNRSQLENQTSRKMKNQLFTEVDGISTNQKDQLLLIGATNLPFQIDQAARRRFTKRYYIRLPNQSQRTKIIQKMLSSINHSLSLAQFQKISYSTEGFSASDLRNLCYEASMIPLRDSASFLDTPAEKMMTKYKHFEIAFKHAKTSLSEHSIELFEKFNQNYGTGFSFQEE